MHDVRLLSAYAYNITRFV